MTTGVGAGLAASAAAIAAAGAAVAFGIYAYKKLKDKEKNMTPEQKGDYERKIGAWTTGVHEQDKTKIPGTNLSSELNAEQQKFKDEYDKKSWWQKLGINYGAEQYKRRTQNGGGGSAAGSTAGSSTSMLGKTDFVMPTHRVGNYDQPTNETWPANHPNPSTSTDQPASPPSVATPDASKSPSKVSGDTAGGDAKVMPISGSVTSLFGNRSNPFGSGKTEGHGAIDIGAPVGSPVYAAQEGTVIRANGTDDPTGYGNVIDIMHKDGYMSRYGHLSGFQVAKGDKIKKGDLIGKSGGAKGAQGSGRSSGPHLHFEVRKNGQKVDPQEFLGMTLQKGSKMDAGGLAGTSPTPAAQSNSLATQQAAKVPSNSGSKSGAVATADQKPTEEKPSLLTSLANSAKSFFGLDKTEDTKQSALKATEVNLKGDTAPVDVEKMAQHIAQFEGFNAPGENWSKINNNPGNLRPTNKDQNSNGGYRVFDTVEEGWQALREKVKSNISKGLNMQEFFGGKKGVYAGYAPKGDGNNDPTKYANYVAKNMGVDPTKPLSLKPTMDNQKLKPESPGVQLAQASSVNAGLKGANFGKDGASNIVNAPSTKITNNNNTIASDVRPKNTDTSYQRNQNAMFVST